MNGASIEIRALDFEQALQAVKNLFARFVDKRPLMERFAAYLELSTVQRFTTNVDPEGRPWKPSLRAQLSGGHTLEQRGLLRDSIHGQAGDDYAEVGTNDPRARIHQFGGVIVPVRAKRLRFQLANGATVFAQRVVMPMRAFLGLSTADRDELLNLAADYATEAARP